MEERNLLWQGEDSRTEAEGEPGQAGQTEAEAESSQSEIKAESGQSEVKAESSQSEIKAESNQSEIKAKSVPAGAIEDLILDETDYDRMMDGKVWEYLKPRRTVRYLDRGEGRLLYCASYLADDPVGTVVISHGFTETEEKYRENIYYFLKQHYHVYMPEHCGHGRSYRLVEDLSLVHVDHYIRYVRDLTAVARLARKEQPQLPMYLFGHSMGGGVAAAVLAVHPDLFQKAVLTSPMIRPLTKGVPWPSAVRLAGALCRLGREDRYVPGGRPFDGNEPFETSASSNRERYEYYQRKRNEEPLYQMSSPSCGWLRGAAGLNRYLRNTAWQKITAPILLFQAEDDTFVVGSEQELFVDRINKAGLTFARLVRVPGTKHEIFNSPKSVLTGYWEKVFDFLSNS